MVEKTAAPVTEAPAEDILPEGDAPFKTTEEAPVEPESTDETAEAKEIADAITPGGEDKPEEEVTDEVADILKEPEPTPEEDKSNVQKRIDRLTAEKKQLEDRLSKLEEAKPKSEKTKYTDDQLAGAMMKAVEDNDKALMRDIIVEIQRNVKDELVGMYSQEKEATTKQVQAIQQEWDQTCDAYNKYADTKTPEIYPGSHKDLNLKDGTSLLYQVAMALYQSNDPEKAKFYRQQGGQKLAVAGALTYILQKKAGRGTNSKVKKLEKQLTKERMKKSPVAGGAGGEEKTSRKPMTESERLEDVINERKKFQEERGL